MTQILEKKWEFSSGSTILGSFLNKVWATPLHKLVWKLNND